MMKRNNADHVNYPVPVAQMHDRNKSGHILLLLHLSPDVSRCLEAAMQLIEQMVLTKLWGFFHKHVSETPPSAVINGVSWLMIVW